MPITARVCAQYAALAALGWSGQSGRGLGTDLVGEACLEHFTLLLLSRSPWQISIGVETTEMKLSFGQREEIQIPISRHGSRRHRH